MRIPRGRMLGSAAAASVRDAVLQAVDSRLTGYLSVKGQGVIILDEGRILGAVAFRDRTVRGEGFLRKLLPTTADIEVHALDDVEMVILTRALGIDQGADLSHVLAPQRREELLRRYGIREPTEMEVESIIRKALEE